MSEHARKLRMCANELALFVEPSGDVPGGWIADIRAAAAEIERLEARPAAPPEVAELVEMIATEYECLCGEDYDCHKCRAGRALAAIANANRGGE